MRNFFAILLLVFVASCTFSIYPKGKSGDKEIVPDSYSERPRFLWKQIVKADTIGAVAVAASDGNGYWSDSLRWENGFLRPGTDTAATRAYARTVAGDAADGNGIIGAMPSGNTQVDPAADATYLFFNWPSGHYKVFSGLTHTYESSGIFDYHLTFPHALSTLDFTVANAYFEMTSGRFSLEADTFKLTRNSNPTSGVPMFILDDDQSDNSTGGAGLQLRADANSSDTSPPNYLPIAYLYKNSYRFRLIHSDAENMQMHFNNVNLDIATSFSKDISVTSADDLSLNAADSITLSSTSGKVYIENLPVADQDSIVGMDANDRLYKIAKPSSGVALDTLENYTALRAYTGSGNAVYVQSQGLFLRSASGSEDGGTVIVAANSVVWRRMFDGYTYFPEFWEDGGYDETGASGGITDTTEMIQAAINMANAAGGGEVILRPQFSPYNVISKVANPRISGNTACLQIKSNVKLTILPNTVLQKADGVQTDAGGPVEVILGICVENVEISGGGKILGNTAGQTGWTGGYAQIIHGTGIYISSTAIDFQCNYNITIRDLEISDHFSNPVDVLYFEHALLENVECHDNGEGPEFVAGQNLSVINIEVADTSGIAEGDGLEIASVNGFSVTDLYVHGVGNGGALELFSSDNGTVTNFVLDGYGGGGITNATNVSNSDISDKIVISNGVIKNYPTGGASGIVCGDGKLEINNVLFDSISVGVNINTAAVVDGRINDITIRSCSFYDYSGQTGVLVQGARKVNVLDCNFRKINVGVQVSYNSAGNTEIKIKDSVFDSTYLHNIQFDAQGQSPPAFDPIAYIENCNFTHALGSKGINGLGYDFDNIFSHNNKTDSYPTHSATTAVNGMEEIRFGAGSNLTTISSGANNQILTVNMKDLPSMNAMTVNDPRNSGGGNIYLQSGEPMVMATGDQLVLKYDKPNNKWLEVARAQTGDFFASGAPVGVQRMVIDGWMATDIQDSLSHQAVYRFGASAETLGDIALLRRDFAVTKFCIYSNTPITTGSVTAELYWNGAGPNKTVTLNSSNPTNNTLTQARFSSIISKNNVIQVKISTSNDFAHPTADIYIWLEGEY